MARMVGLLRMKATTSRTDSNMAVTHPENLAFAVPEYKMDQIVDIIEGSFAIGAGVTDGFGFVTAAEASDVKAQLANDFFYIKGLWSHNGGASWQELGMDIILGDSANGLRTLTVDANSVNTTGLNVFATNSGASGYTITYKVILMARQDQGSIGVTELNQPLRYNSKFKYMKIIQEGVVALPTGSSDTQIPHNLGRIPNILAWYQTEFTPEPGIIWITFPRSSVYVNTHSLVCTANSQALQPRTLHYRIYLDDQI